MIRNKAIINEDTSGTILILKNEIKRLKKELAESDKRMNVASHQCPMCKTSSNNLGIPEEEDCEELDQDENLLSDSMDTSLLASDNNPLNLNNSNTNNNFNGPLNEALRQKFKIIKSENVKMRKRVIYLENLLSANLDNLTQQ